MNNLLKNFEGFEMTTEQGVNTTGGFGFHEAAEIAARQKAHIALAIEITRIANKPLPGTAGKAPMRPRRPGTIGKN